MVRVQKQILETFPRGLVQGEVSTVQCRREKDVVRERGRAISK